MRPHVIALASAKGGSGKTVTAASLGTFLSSIGLRTLLVDADAATNGLSLLYLTLIAGADKQGRGMFEVRSDSDTITVLPLAENLDLLPATYSFLNTENVSLDQFTHAVHRVLYQAREVYDYILLDAQAGSDYFAHVCMTKEVSDEVILVSEYDPSSAAGVERLKGLFPQDLTYARTWVLLNKVLPEFVDAFKDFLQIAKYASPIVWNADVVRAYARRTLPIDVTNGNRYTFSIMQTAESILGNDISDSLHKWLNDHASSVREPIEKELQATQARLLEAEVGLVEATTSIRRKTRMKYATLGLAGILTTGLTGSVLVSTDLFGSIPQDRPQIWLVTLAICAAAVALYINFSALGLSRARDDPYRSTKQMQLARERAEAIAEERRLQRLIKLPPAQLVRDGVMLPTPDEK